MSGEPGDVTRLLARLREGNRAAEAELAPLIYGELHVIAARSMRRERPGHTLQPTALVHEAFLRLMGQRDIAWQNRAHFFAVAAGMMRRILTDYARRRHAVRRGSGPRKVTFEDQLLIIENHLEDVIALDEALDRLAALDPDQAKLVELRFFAGLRVEEIAEVMGISTATVKREWSSAKAWLHQQITLECRNDTGAVAGR